MKWSLGLALLVAVNSLVTRLDTPEQDCAQPPPATYTVSGKKPDAGRPLPPRRVSGASGAKQPRRAP